VRTICPACKTAYIPPAAVQNNLGAEEGKRIQLYRGKGCQECYDSGFKGRTGIYELMEIDNQLRSLILESPTSDILQEHFLTNGHQSMSAFGYERVREGITTLEEVKRVTSAEM